MQPYADKLAELNRTIDQNPDDARAVAQRGETHRLQGEYEKALTDFSRAIELDPTYGWAIAHRGETYHLLERYQEALADFDRAIDLTPDYVWAIAHRGEVYGQIKYYEEALADFSQAIKLNPDYIWAIAHRGVVYRRMRRYQESLADLTKVINLQPDNAWALVHRTETYVMMKCYKEALVDADRVVALDPAIVSHWRGERGLLLNYLGRYEETIECCQLALQEAPDDHIALYSLTVAKALSNKLTQADIITAQAVLQSVTATNERGRVLYRLGGLAALQGKTDQALNYLQEAILLDDEPGEVARHDPAWSKLRTVPRFQALIDEPVSI